VIQPQSG